MNFFARSFLFAVTSISIAFAFGCEIQATHKSGAQKQIQQLTAEKADLQNQLEQVRAENSQLLKENQTLSKLPGEKRTDALYHIKSVKIGSYTNIYNEEKTRKKNLVVYVEPIDETGDAVKAGGSVDIQLWNLNKKEDEARLAQWQVGPDELKKLWLSGIFSSSYRLSFDVTGIVDKFDKPLTVKVEFTDYLSGQIFSEQFIINPPKPGDKK